MSAGPSAAHNARQKFTIDSRLQRVTAADQRAGGQEVRVGRAELVTVHDLKGIVESGSGKRGPYRSGQTYKGATSPKCGPRGHKKPSRLGQRGPEGSRVQSPEFAN